MWIANFRRRRVVEICGNTLGITIICKCEVATVLDVPENV